ncbi:MAG: alpha/beta hydrolase [Rhodoferax sp.]|jgi:predicted alpha/beta-fold hydrolase|uniref:YheT family hydrolase n=1 Tax=Rhodoferax sp. TaxID=50421 RepID=UPI001B67FE55|nr:alpha/beta fold hydrolase [Rhodoferax sp.]MBP8286991.1 alpha/beta hydrolase [Rhodoferax sp.]MBP9735084.1 alpha/beta hydrolase [Rhodoferax sp.]
MEYAAPFWLPGGHLQTIWPALFGRYGRRSVKTPAINYQRVRWATPDQDFIDLDWLHGVPGKPLLVLFHGLEGSSQSHYALAFAEFAKQHGLSYVVPHFRGCSGEINLAPRAYHSGDFEEIDWILRRLHQQHTGEILALGVSLGGNALLRWGQEMGQTTARVVAALASVCAPLDLSISGHAMGRGLNRQIYTRMFLASMKPKAMRKLAQHPGLFSATAMQAATDLFEFDNIFTAPLHGFKNTHDYWLRASAKPGLAQIRVPTLVVNARNDPFVPAGSLPKSSKVGQSVTLWQPQHGGHVGFAVARATHAQALPDTVGHWLLAHAGSDLSRVAGVKAVNHRG